MTTQTKYRNNIDYNICIMQKRSPVLFQLKDFFEKEGIRSRINHRKSGYSDIVLYGPMAYKVLQRMYPHLICKRREASWAMSYYAVYLEKGNRRKKFTEAQAKEWADGLKQIRTEENERTGQSGYGG